jgi:hypothetical protein
LDSTLPPGTSCISKIFKRGLNKELKDHLAVMCPKTLEEAMALAQQVEVEMRNNARGANGNGSGAQGNSLYRTRVPFSSNSYRGSNGNNNHAVPMELSHAMLSQEQDGESSECTHEQVADSAQQSIHALAGQQSQRKRLSPEQMKDYMRRGICFNCGKPGHVSRYCPSRSIKPQAQQSKNV